MTNKNQLNKMSERIVLPAEAAHLRVGHNQEFVQPLGREESQNEARRCLDCGTPFCRSGCPIGNNIPGFQRAVAADDDQLAYEILRRTNPFPEFTGRVCPAPCESACTKGLVDQPVAIESLEKTVADRAWQMGVVQPQVPTNRRDIRVGVVGSGPAGLAAAHWLNQWGYRVTVLERSHTPGGLLVNGIPRFKLDKELVAKRIQVMVAEGVEFRTGVTVGDDLTGSELLEEFHRLVLACGATKARPIAFDHPMIYGADAYLIDHIWHGDERQNRFQDKTVLVLGGGDTGSDCVGTANRQGAKNVIQVEIMPEPDAMAVYPRLQSQPSSATWPDLPRQKRTSTSHEEGCERLWNLEMRELACDGNGKLLGVRFTDKASNTLKFVPCDAILVAIGYLGAEANPVLEQLQLSLNDRSQLTTHQGRTENPRVYGAGDMSRGASLVVNALADGLTVAKAIHQDCLAAKNSATQFPAAKPAAELGCRS